MATPYMSEICIVAFGFAPKGYAQCNGQLLPINQNQALFSLLGTTYGGDGRVNFGLPNFQGRVPVHFGESYTLGQVGGATSVTMQPANIPDHIHTVQATLTQPVGSAATTTSPANAYPAVAAAGSPRYNGKADEAMAVTQATLLVTDPANGPLMTENNTTASAPILNVMPYLALNYIIALQGIFPSQN
jgi:microcystin-dependent protein